jgi:hypothetical protein
MLYSNTSGENQSKQDLRLTMDLPVPMIPPPLRFYYTKPYILVQYFRPGFLFFDYRIALRGHVHLLYFLRQRLS